MNRLTMSFIIYILIGAQQMFGQLDVDLFLKYDSALISLWDAADRKDQEQSLDYLDQIQNQIKEVHIDLQKSTIIHLNQEEYFGHAHVILKLLRRYVAKKDYTKVKFFCYDLLHENYAVRSCWGSNLYPLDELIELKEAYLTVESAVTDPMMKLLEWFEFIDLVDQMISRFEEYDCIQDSDILIVTPDFDVKKHNLLKLQANICIEDLIESMESGYQENFTSPCLELGKAIDNILKLYK